MKTYFICMSFWKPPRNARFLKRRKQVGPICIWKANHCTKKVHSFQTYVWTLNQWMCLASGYVSVRARKNYISFVLTHFWIHCKLLENLIKRLEIYHDFLRARACVHMCARACIALSRYCPLSRTSAKNKTAFALCYKVLNDLPLKWTLKIFYSQPVASLVV